MRGELGRGRVLSVCQWLAADCQRGEIAVDYQRHPGTRGYFTTTHPPANQKMLSTENLQRLDFSNLGENGQEGAPGRQVTTRLRPTTIYCCLLGGRRSSRGTKCDLYIYSKRPREKFIPDSVSHKAGRHFWGCTKVIYPFVKSSLSPGKRFSNVD